MEGQEETRCFVFTTPDGRAIGISAYNLKDARDQFLSLLDRKKVLCWFDPELIEPEVY